MAAREVSIDRFTGELKLIRADVYLDSGRPINEAPGEQPLLLAISVWTAVKNALGYATKKQIVPLRIPATQEHIHTCMREGQL